jgi:hypothetical protein
MGFPSKFPQSNNTNSGEQKRYQNVGAIWERTSKKDGTKFFSVDINVNNKEGTNGALLLQLQTGTNPDGSPIFSFYNVKSISCRAPKSENPKAPTYNLSVNLDDDYQVEALDNSTGSQADEG